MVNDGIVLGHKISERGIEVDRAKIEEIEKMPYPRDVKGILVFFVMLVSIGDLLMISLRNQDLLLIFFKSMLLLFFMKIVRKLLRFSRRP